MAYEKLSDQQRKSEVLTPYDGIPNDAFSIPASREGGSFVISRDHVVRGFSLRQIHDREISVGLGQDIRKERKYYDLSTGLGRLNATFFLLKSHASQFSTSGLLEIDWTEGLFSWGSGLDFNIAERGEQIWAIWGPFESPMQQKNVGEIGNRLLAMDPVFLLANEFGIPPARRSERLINCLPRLKFDPSWKSPRDEPWGMTLEE